MVEVSYVGFIDDYQEILVIFKLTNLMTIDNQKNYGIPLQKLVTTAINNG